MPVTRRRKSLCVATVLAAMILAADPASPAGNPPARKRTFTYKRVGALEIRADVYRPDGSNPLPVVVNIHGGGLMKMDRSSVPPPASLLMDSGLIVVSVDYRLGPETKLPEIIQDVVDSCAWVRRDGPRLFGADPRRLAVVGASAGGFLTLVAGFRVEPKPDVVVSEFGFAELFGPWATKPSPDPEHWETMLTKAEAEKMPAGPEISNATERAFAILPFYNYFRQNGLLPRMLTGWDPAADREKYLPYLPLFNVTPAYPPTMLIHGTKDPDVPVEQSKLMAAALEKHGVRHETVFVEGAEHGLRGVDPGIAQAAHRAGADFVLSYLKPGEGRRH
jgi:acetyl esterase/lipase